MNLEKESKLMTSRPPQPIGKSQLYTLLVDAAGAPVLDGDGNQQVVALQSVDGKLQVNSGMEGYGATVATRPLATAVPIGFVFMSVATQEIWQSDGTNWVVM